MANLSDWIAARLGPMAVPDAQQERLHLFTAMMAAHCEPEGNEPITELMIGLVMSALQTGIWWGLILGSLFGALITNLVVWAMG
jgi:hypothetical protein